PGPGHVSRPHRRRAAGGGAQPLLASLHANPVVVPSVGSDLRQQAADARPCSAGNASMSAVEVEALAVSFTRAASHIAAVRGVSFAVAEGETFGLVGPSGCGKSTVLRVIAGLQREWSGRVAALRQ